MSVLIKGMEMPTRCFACPLCIGEENDWSCAISHGPYIEYRVIETDIAIDTCPDWCPLVSIPPHGRLIDADAFLDDLLFPSKQFEQGMRELIADTPTIIPADPPEEE